MGGIIRNIRAFRIGRDAVSISGGNRGRRVRDVTVRNVSLKKGLLRGAVEVSDGTDNIKVRGVYAERCAYAIDVQDHGGKSAPNTNIDIQDVTAVNCRHIVRTANSRRGHAGLTLRDLTARRCEAPVRITNTRNVAIDTLKILDHRSRRSAPIDLQNCRGVTLGNVTVETARFADRPVQTRNCHEVDAEDVTTSKLQ